MSSMAKSWLKSIVDQPGEMLIERLPPLWREVKAMTTLELGEANEAGAARRKAGVWSPRDELIRLEHDRRTRATEQAGEGPSSQR